MTRSPMHAESLKALPSPDADPVQQEGGKSAVPPSAVLAAGVRAARRAP
ncbi:MAG: hypothetical protein ACRDGV_03595 [Candidatus Limnocylindria bacterium]